MKTDSPQRRLYSLDVSRGLAALSVVTWHWQHFAYEGNILSSNFTRESQPFYGILKLFYEKGSAGVDYFFILSGYIFFWLYRNSIAKKRISAQTFFVKRISRLYPLHIFTLALVTLLQNLYIYREGVSFVYTFNDVYHFLLNLLFASNWGFERGLSFNAPVWSVSIEILLYFIFFTVALIKLGGKKSSILISITSFVLWYYFRFPLLNGLALFFWGGVVSQFTLQISVSNKYFKKAVYFVAISSWVFVAINCYFIDLSSIVQCYGLIGKVFLIGFTTYILFPFTVCGLTLFEIDNGSIFKTISWIGDVSYSLYLLHFPLQLSFELAVSYCLISSSFYKNPMYFLIFLAILISMSYIVYQKLERPAKEFLRKRFIYSNVRSDTMCSN